MKNVTGYDLSKLVAGSHGTLAALTEVTFKALPKPETEQTLLLTGLGEEAGAAAVSGTPSSPMLLCKVRTSNAMSPAFPSPLVEEVIADPFRSTTWSAWTEMLPCAAGGVAEPCPLNAVFASSLAWSITNCPPLMKMEPAGPV